MFATGLRGENMIGFVSGLIVFGLYALYDVNSVKWKHWLLNRFFLAGTFLLGLATVVQAFCAFKTASMTIRSWLFLAAAVVFFLLLIYTLFFALPFEETYIQQSEKPKVYSGGMYALCRHPGVIWFFLFYLCLGLAIRPSGLLAVGLFYSFLNLLYIILQDLWTFPKTFEDYDEYKKIAPFLFPTPASIKRAYVTWK